MNNDLNLHSIGLASLLWQSQHYLVMVQCFSSNDDETTSKIFGSIANNLVQWFVRFISFNFSSNTLFSPPLVIFLVFASLCNTATIFVHETDCVNAYKVYILVLKILGNWE